MSCIFRKNFKGLITTLVLLVIVVSTGFLRGSFYGPSEVLVAEAGTPVTWTGLGDGTSWSDPANWSSDPAVPGPTNDVTIDANATVNLASTTTITSLVLGNVGGTTAPVLNFNYDAITSGALILSTGDLVVNTASSITHTTGTTAVVGTVYLDVQTGSATINGTIDVSLKGYLTNSGISPGSVSGGDGNGKGAAHGGAGGGDYNNTVYVNNAVYGSITAPTSLGSGGGSGTTVPSGGGAVKMNVAGTATINGAITANANTVVHYHASSGGAGGSIDLTAGILAGTGSITANGGKGGHYVFIGGGGGGGGGRIAVHYTTDNSTLSYTAYGGLGDNGNTSNQNGGAGTIFKKAAAQANGELIIDNNNIDTANSDLLMGYTPLTPSGTPLSVTFDTVTLQNDGALNLNSDTTLSYTSLNWATAGKIADNGGVMPLTAAASDVVVPATAVLFANTAHTGLSAWNSLTVNGTLSHSTNFSSKTNMIDLDISTNLIVDGAGSIDASVRGYVVNQGTGAGNYINADGNGRGAAYGGAGGGDYNNTSSVNNTVYGSITAPTDLGSGGGYLGSAVSASGGGAIKLNVTGTSTINGTIMANANTVANYRASSGGAGGSVFITTGTLAGTGSITANGGKGGYYIYGGAGGGGGRIAVHYTTDNSTLSYAAYGGSGKAGIDTSQNGGAGTVFTKSTAQTNGDLLIDNNNSDTYYKDLLRGYTPLTPSGTPLSITFDTVTLQNDGALNLNSDTTLSYTTLDWSTSGKIVDNGGTIPLLATSSDVIVPVTAELVANTAHTGLGAWNSLIVNGSLKHSSSNAIEVARIDLQTLADITISSTASVNLDGVGFLENNGPGAGIDAGAYGSGAGHGGVGGGITGSPASGGPTYGVENAPITLGSGGGKNGSGIAGDGGGAIKLVAGRNMVLDADISVNGTAGQSLESGGGSGGSIWIDVAGLLSGTGNLYAKGGSAASVNSGAGAGGRVRYSCSNTSWSGAVSVVTGSVGIAGASGSVSAACVVNNDPAASAVSGTQPTDGSGTVNVQFTIDDADNDDTIQVLLEYNIGSGWQKATVTTADGSTTANFGDPKVDNATTYQIGGAAGYVLSSSGANTISTLWEARTDEPTASLSTAKLRVTPFDSKTVGPTVESPNFNLDVVPPTFTSASYKDMNIDGTVDRVDLVFNENIVISNYNTADWTFTEPGTVNLDDTGASASTNSILLTVSGDVETTGGATDPTVLFTNNGNRVTDTAGNFLASFGGSQTVTDAADPLIISTLPLVGDIVNANSDIVVNFSEAMNTGSVTYSFTDPPSGLSSAFSDGDKTFTVSHTGGIPSGANSFTITSATGSDGRTFGMKTGVTQLTDFTVPAPSSSASIPVTALGALINDGGVCVSATDVLVKISANNASSYIISTKDTFVGSHWESFSGAEVIGNLSLKTVPWTFDSVSGEKKLYVMFRSSTGELSSILNDSITLDLVNNCGNTPVTPPSTGDQTSDQPTVDQPAVDQPTTDNPSTEPPSSEVLPETPIVNQEPRVEVVPIADGDTSEIVRILLQYGNIIINDGYKAFVPEGIMQEAPASLSLGVSPFTGDNQYVSVLHRGDFVKAKTNAQIYYIGDGDTRSPVLDLGTYYTYFPSLSYVKIVTEATLPNFKIVRAIVPKARTVLVKFWSEPEIYFVTENPDGSEISILHEISKEQALEYFGIDWEIYLLDINQAYWESFIVGDKITSEEEVADRNFLNVYDIKDRINGLVR